MIFAYYRISTDNNSQKTDRQKLTVSEFAQQNIIQIDEVFEEHISGKSIDRPQYNIMRSKLRCNDILILSDLDRLGRNATQVIAECQYYKMQGIKLVVLDVPFLNDWKYVCDNTLYEMVTDILITLKAHIAQQEREKIVQRVNQGLASAKAKGVKLGRPHKEWGKEILEINTRICSGELKKIEAAKILNVSRQHLNRLLKRYCCK